MSALCNGRDIRNVTRANDTAGRASYAPAMTDRIGKEHTMKRIATIGAVITAFAVAPSLAAGGNFAAEIKPQVSAQVVGAQVAKAQVARAERAQAAISVQRHAVQIKLAMRFAVLRAQVR
jgi:hypothetical protein